MVHTSQYGSGVTHFHYLITRIVQYGARGVQLFFVASAFTLFLSMANRKQEEHPNRNFFIRRFFRIAPMYWVGIIFYSFWFIYVQPRPVSTGNVIANFLFAHGISPYWINSLVPGGWSITVEMTFYCVAPWLFSKIRTLDKAVRFVIISLLFNTLLSYALLKHSLIADKDLWVSFLFLYFPSQLPVFGIGIVLFFLLRQREEKEVLKPMTILASAIMLIANLTLEIPYLPEHFWFGTGFLLLAVALSRQPFRVLVNPIIIYIGKISFSLYLVHFAVLFSLDYTGHADFLHPNGLVSALINYGLRFLLVLVVSSGLAKLFFEFVEVPFQKLGKKLIIRLER